MASPQFILYPIQAPLHSLFLALALQHGAGSLASRVPVKDLRRAARSPVHLNKAARTTGASELLLGVFMSFARRVGDLSGLSNQVPGSRHWATG